uniref:TVP38/TMEM64 family membrane protein slr0305 n=1 Tax=Erigeron canadensis TaxID=72917 RepID=UPI001CB8FB67|nr:TVP38/TMEM64 family membrane protein slr0305 [Erigeron canadensis]
MRLLLRPPPPCFQSQQSCTRPNSHFSTTSSSSSCTSSSFSIFSFKPLNKRFHFLNPTHSSLKQTNKQQTTTLQTKNNTPPQSSIKRLLNLNNTNISNNNNNNSNNNDDENDDENENGNAIKGTIVAGLLLIGVVGGFGTVGYIYRDQINAFLIQFSSFIEGYGPAGYALFVAVYAGLEVLAIPAIPLTMSAGLLFGSVTGTILVSISGTVAASVAFLIARYFARDRILKMVEGNKKFLAIDKAIGENGFRVVTLLRLSPLLPFSLGNYLYGLTSVKFVPYVLGSWLGMLPGTWAYVSAGAFGRAIIQEESELGLTGGTNQLLTLGVGLLATALAASYVTRLAKDAMKDIDE